MMIDKITTLNLFTIHVQTGGLCGGLKLQKLHRGEIWMNSPSKRPDLALKASIMKENCGTVPKSTQKRPNRSRIDLWGRPPQISKS